MFNLDQAIAAWRRQMAAGGVNSPEVWNELESHLRDDLEQRIRSGLNPQPAFEAAVQQIGQADALKKEFKKAGVIKWALHKKLRVVLAQLSGGRDAIPVLSLSEFSASAQQVLELAREEPLRFHHDFIGTEHVLLGLLKMEQGIVPNILRGLGVSHETIRMEVEKFVGLGAVHPVTTPIPYTPRARKALLLAANEAKALRHAHVGTEHIFLGLLLEGGGIAALVLRNLGVQIESTREAVLRELRSDGTDI
ncbi:MAG: NDP-hexose 4-ketoreductase [Pedosphaera sp.]|nr:NDP-hexose 4-ketoreductase [Pedosphaera sp.]